MAIFRECCGTSMLMMMKISVTFYCFSPQTLVVTVVQPCVDSAMEGLRECCKRMFCFTKNQGKNGVPALCLILCKILCQILCIFL